MYQGHNDMGNEGPRDIPSLSYDKIYYVDRESLRKLSSSGLITRLIRIPYGIFFYSHTFMGFQLMNLKKLNLWGQ
jgi:hypothetical protein